MRYIDDVESRLLVRTMKQYSFFTVFLFLFFGQNAIAIECNDKSPHFSQMGDQYFEFDSVPESTDREKMYLQEFVGNLYGKWIFEIDEISCKGSGESMRKNEREGKGTAVFEQSSVFPLVIKMETEIDRNNKKHKLDLLALDATFDFSVFKDRISAAQFRRERHRGFGTNFYEYDYQIAKLKGKVNLQVDVYVSGLFAYRWIVQFTRR